MTINRRAARRDTSEASIVQFLRKAGWSVLKLSQKDAPDLVLGKQTRTGGINLLAEVKTGKGKLRKGQKDWAEKWNGHPPYVLRAVEDAEALTRAVNKL